jgi:hypothetical protein
VRNLFQTSISTCVGTNRQLWSAHQGAIQFRMKSSSKISIALNCDTC